MITLKDNAAADAVYGALRTEGNRTTYIGGNHTDVIKDQLSLTSTPPKKSNSSYGNRRSSFNLVRSVTVATPLGGTEVKDMKFELVVSLPVGVSDSDIAESIARMNALIELPVAIDDVAVVGKTQL